MANKIVKGTKNTPPVRFVGAAIVVTVVSYIINTIGAFATMDYYFDPAYFSVWSKIMMPTAGPPPQEFAIYSLILGFIAALLFVFVYGRVKSVFNGKNAMKSGMCYGMLVFLVGTLPGMFSMSLLINLPAGLLVAWTIFGLIMNMVGGVIVAKMMK
jgi:hypothetical protein